jgi:glycosyltransferase involved in cell wall biosynthesis
VTSLNTRVLFLAYHYPPVGGGSVQRSVRFATLLPEYGFEPVCVTGPGTARTRWTPEDETLGNEIPADIELHRVKGPEPPPPSAPRASVNRWLRRRAAWTRWWWEGAMSVGLEVAETADLIYVQMQPYDTAEVGTWLAQSSGKPWVADLLDPWALDEMMIYPTRFHRSRELARMGSTLATASAIVMNTPEAAIRVRRELPMLRNVPIYSISNGFHPPDFEGDVALRCDGTFRIVHTGYLHTELGQQMRRRTLIRRLLGGNVPGVDIFTRSHVFLLEAIDRLTAHDPELAATIEVHLAGVLSQRDREIAKGLPFVRLHGYLNHPETVALQRSADLLFLPMHNLPPGTRATIVPGKTWEYLASARPILAAIPEGDARDVLTAAGSAFVVRPDDVAGMAEILKAQVRRAREGMSPPAADPSVVERYAYPHLTNELAAVFDAVLARGKRKAAAAVATTVASS